ncbi:hypothetical protein Patl1_17391 [Pistacia atlantica]|uniref:Uncharacterized protein n=1 Tax=Pistacia atlantica TaxID=434234 RepID=A0ACC1C2C5_9ROSI|nr:hypothetical protein Patl1_17391 [Pistacia atlantica]
MATVTASQFVPGSTQLYGTSGAAVEANLVQMGLRNQSMTHNGLRSLNVVDRLQMKITSKAMRNKAVKKVRSTASDIPSGKIVCGQGMRIVVVSAEVGPWSKTGGLGDVTGGLPPAQAANGHRVMTVSPRYDQLKLGIELKLFDSSTATNEELIVSLLIIQCSLRRFGEKLEPKYMAQGQDRITRTTNFDLAYYARQAALEAPRVLNLNNSEHFSGPYGKKSLMGKDVVFVCNDWHTALLPCYLKSMYQSRGIYKNAKVAFCIHNIAYQGRFAIADFSLLNLPDQFRGSFDFIDGYNTPVKGRKINWMKAGILESDRVVTSGTLQQTNISMSNMMPPLLWNAKPLLKEALQAEVGLPVDKNIPVIGFIGRLEEQKGSDILVAAISKFIGENVQIVVLGTGKKYMEKQIEQLEIKYPDKAIGVAKFNAPLAHKIIAGADYMLITSRFEPCGLIQLQAQRYGTVPIVSSTGGLVDTVKEGFTGFHMGSFNVDCEKLDPADVDAVATTVKRVLTAYGTPAFKEMIKNCMAKDLSWKGPAKLWEKMLLSLEVAGSEAGSEEEEIGPLGQGKFSHSLSTPFKIMCK